jgi:hypothetical protein
MFRPQLKGDLPKLLGIAAEQLINQLGSKVMLQLPFPLGWFYRPIIVIHQSLG